jgi:metal-dependent amidase/aminoacylase/carboxypeptidase family protein
VSKNVAAAHGCSSCTIQFTPDYYPPTVNDPALYETFSKPVASLASENGTVLDVDPVMGAEDFAFLAEAIPSTFFFLGQGGRADKNDDNTDDGDGREQGDATRIGPSTHYSVHHPCFALDESILTRGVELHVNLALRALRMLGGRSPAILASASEY